VFDAWEKKPAWPDTDERFVDEAIEAVVGLVETPFFSSSNSFSFTNNLWSSFYLSFSCSTDSTIVTARLRFTKFEVPIETNRKARYAQKVSTIICNCG